MTQCIDTKKTTKNLDVIVTESDKLNITNYMDSDSIIVGFPVTPTKPHSSIPMNRRCDCDCECWQQSEYPILTPRILEYKFKEETKDYAPVMACRHFASCYLSGATCISE
jgi:hypothetical protein